MENIEHWLFDEQNMAIKVILICRHEGEDKRIWPYSKNGEYSFKSGYRKLKEERVICNDKPPFSRIVNGDIWNIIWKLKVPSKIQIFYGEF